MHVRILTKLEDGRLEATPTDWASFLYDDASPSINNPNLAAFDYDEEDMEGGLCRGYFLVRVSFLGTVYLFTNNYSTGLPTHLLWTICSQQVRDQWTEPTQAHKGC